MNNQYNFTRIVILFALLFLCFSEKLIAQNKEKEGSPKYYRIHKVLMNEYTFEVLNDSIPLFALNFKITVKKIGKKQVVKVWASDSLAYAIFPGYRKYYSFDFSPYMNSKQEVSFFLPVLILNRERVELNSGSQRSLISINNIVKLFEKILYVDKSLPNILMLDIITVEKLNLPKNK